MSLASPQVRGRVSSADGTRTALVNALNSAGLNATAYAPDSPTENAAWPQWSITNWNGHVCDPARYTFDVYAVLGAGDPETTVAAGDALVSQVAPALWPVAVIQSAEPVLITFADQTTMPGIRFRVVSRA
jgi:hypothetical protein